LNHSIIPFCRSGNCDTDQKPLPVGALIAKGAGGESAQVEVALAFGVGTGRKAGRDRIGQECAGGELGEHDRVHIDLDAGTLDVAETLRRWWAREPKRDGVNAATWIPKHQNQVIVENPVAKPDLTVALAFDVQQIGISGKGDQIGLMGRRNVELGIGDVAGVE
jgi:hypothetical protein